MKFKVGDVVKIVGAVDGKHKKLDNTDGFKNNWVKLMDKFIGKVCTVRGITKNGIELTDCNDYKFPPRALELFTEKTKIQKDKKYQTVEGNYPAWVVCTDRIGEQSCIVLYRALNVEAIYLNEYGENCCGFKIIEEVPEVDWSKVEVNTPILVKCLKAGTYVPKHFSHFSSGLVWYFNDGRTSHTSFEGPSLTEPKYATLTNPNEKA